MSAEKKFGLLRRVLRAIGLSPTAVDDSVDFIVERLSGEEKVEQATAAEFPYHLRDHFLSPAELNFYGTLRSTIDGRAVLLTKVALGDVFYVKKGDDLSRYRVYTNKIDRKHVDFLLCDPISMCPIVGIELDDKSHERPDRRERDAFVDSVFAAAKLPLLHVPVRRGYDVRELSKLLAPYLKAELDAKRAVEKVPNTPAVPIVEVTVEAPCCPKCGSEMVLRTAKSGANAGNKFWGCSRYPTCRSMLPYEQG